MLWGRYREGTDPRDEMQQTLIEYLRKSELAQPWEAVETAETLEAALFILCVDDSRKSLINHVMSGEHSPCPTV
jgi:hypothetical protein